MDKLEPCLVALIALALSGCATFDSKRQRDTLAWQFGDPVPQWWAHMPGRCTEAKVHNYNWSFAECRKLTRTPAKHEAE